MSHASLMTIEWCYNTQTYTADTPRTHTSAHQAACIRDKSVTLTAAFAMPPNCTDKVLTKHSPLTWHCSTCKFELTILSSSEFAAHA